MEKNYIGLLIDAENMSYRYIEKIMGKIAKYVEENTKENQKTKLTHKLAFANWYENTTDEWLSVLKQNGIKQKHSSSNSVGKNASDISLVIYAMDAVFNKGIDTFIIVTCDSDFTELAYRLTEYGKKVIICGNESTSQSLKNSGEDFWEVRISPENKRDSKINEGLKSRQTTLISKNDKKEVLKDYKEIEKIARYVYKNAIGNDSEDRIDMSYIYAEMKRVGLSNNHIIDYKKLRFQKLKPFLKKLGIFKFSQIDKGDTITHYVQLK